MREIVVLVLTVAAGLALFMLVMGNLALRDENLALRERAEGKAKAEKRSDQMKGRRCSEELPKSGVTTCTRRDKVVML